MKPGKLFESLKQGDPQAVAATAVLLFLFSVCWFSWTLLTPPSEDALPLGGGARRPPPAPDETPLSAIIREQQSLAAADQAPNPFHRDVPVRPTPKPRPTREPKKPVQGSAAENGDGENASPPPTPADRTVRVGYVYKGMMRRPDGTVVAMVSNPKDGSSRFVRQGDLLVPLTLLEISPDGLELRRDDDAPIFMPRGEVQTFEYTPE